MKGGIEACHLEHVGPMLENGPNGGEIKWLVKGSKRNQLFKLLDNSNIDPHGSSEFQTTMNYTMTYRHNGVTFHRPVCAPLEQKLYGFPVTKVL